LKHFTSDQLILALILAGAILALALYRYFFMFS